MNPGLFPKTPSSGARRGMRLDELSHPEFVALPNGTRAVYREGVYEEDFYKHGDLWFWGEGGRRAPVSTLLLARLTSIPAGRAVAVPPPPPAAPTPPESRRDRERREALERIASGTSGASDAEVAVARRALRGGR